MRNLILVITLFIYAQSFAQSKNNKTLEEKEGELVDFSNIQEILKEDELTQEVKKESLSNSNNQKKRKKEDLQRYKIPDEKEIWSFLSEIWLVKSASVLKWDFQKPDYGIEESLKSLIEEMGYYEVDLKIILVNTPILTHMAFRVVKGNIFLF